MSLRDNRNDCEGGQPGISVAPIFWFGSFFFIFQRQGLAISLLPIKSTLLPFFSSKNNPLSHALNGSHLLSLKIYSSFTPLDFEDGSLF